MFDLYAKKGLDGTGSTGMDGLWGDLLRCTGDLEILDRKLHTAQW